jgi:hypothetical protein
MNGPLRSTYSTIETVKLLPTLSEEDMADSELAGTAMGDLLLELRIRVGRALTILAKVADDRESGWPETQRIVQSYFKDLEFGPIDGMPSQRT